MISKERDELRAIRVEVAVQICLRFPHLYEHLTTHNYPVHSKEEGAAALMLHSLLNQEPCVKYILDFYYKRELR